MHLDNDAVAMLLIFPSQVDYLVSRLEVPADFCGSETLIAALFSTSLTANEFQITRWRSLEGAPEPTDYQALLREKRVSLTGSHIHRALHILGIPKVLLDFLVRTPRRYCIWHSSADGTTAHPGLETTLLKTVLSAFSAEDVGYKTDVRAIFVHVGAVSTLHKLQALAERRSKHPQLQFWTYGTDESVHPDRWGVKLIYPCGRRPIVQITCISMELTIIYRWDNHFYSRCCDPVSGSRR